MVVLHIDPSKSYLDLKIILNSAAMFTANNLIAEFSLKSFNFEWNLKPLYLCWISHVFHAHFLSLKSQHNDKLIVTQTSVFYSRTLWTNVPVIAVLFTLSWMAGMVIFADYINCDPLTLGYISKMDEIVPFYVEDKFTHIPGLLGVFMASLFNGALRYLLFRACSEFERKAVLKCNIT